MKCDCGYEGWAEIGQFKDERKPVLPFKVTHRCPKCKTNKNINYLDSIDTILSALIYPQFCRGKMNKNHQTIKKKVQFITGGAESSIVGYSIHCPICNYGTGSAIPLKDFEKLTKKFQNLSSIDVNTGLAKINKEAKKNEI